MYNTANLDPPHNDDGKLSHTHTCNIYPINFLLLFTFVYVIADSPVCQKDQRTFYAARPNEQIRISCKMDADPVDLHFKWRTNSSLASSSEIDSFHSNGTLSIAHYKARYRFGHEIISCHASNEIGLSKEACFFQIVPAGKPEICNFYYLNLFTSKNFNWTCKQINSISFWRRRRWEAFFLTRKFFLFTLFLINFEEFAWNKFCQLFLLLSSSFSFSWDLFIFYFE